MSSQTVSRVLGQVQRSREEHITITITVRAAISYSQGVTYGSR